MSCKRRDIIGIAQTGTGKTASFTLPMIELLARGRAKARMPRSLILEPTRELAAQVAESFERYGKYNKLSMALLIGGVSFDDQDKKLDRGVDVLIATPGRLLDHFERGKLMLSQVQILVIDEADRMLDMGFIPDVERICKLIPFTRQTLVLLGDHAAGNPAAHRAVPAQSGARGSVAARHDRRRTSRRKSSTFRTTTGPSARRCAASSAKQPTSRTPSSSAIASAMSTSSPNRWRSTASTPRRCMATSTSRVRTQDARQPSATAKSSCWWPATSRRAASTFPAVSHIFNFDVPFHRRRLCPPHRPHRPRRTLGPCLHAGHAARRRNLSKRSRS